MKSYEDEPCPIAVLLSEDDGAVICAAGQALVAAVRALRIRVSAWRISRRGRYRGSLPGRRTNKQRDFDAGLNNIVRDYFGVYGQDPVYNEHDFETRFLVPRAVFRRVYSEVKDTPFFRRQIKATGRPQAHPLQKVIAAFRVLAYGEAADRADEYVRLPRSTILLSVKCLVVCIVSKWESTCLRRPNNAELKTILDRNAERGFPGCMGSLDCRHWAWYQCPRDTAGSYQIRKGSRGIIMEAVCDEDLWIWHLFVGAPGSLNHLNVMHQSPLYLDVTAGGWPPRNQSYTLNGTSRTPPYYLVDGIYPRYAFLMSLHPMPSTEEQKVFICLQEAVRKDVERLFGVLTQRLPTALHPGRYRSVKMLVLTFMAICILHNICVKSRREGFLSRRRRAEGPNGGRGPDAVDGDVEGSGSEDGSGPDGGPAGGGGSGNGGGADVRAGAAAGGAAPGGAHAGANAPLLINPVEQPPAGGMPAVFDAWAETRNVAEHKQLRVDLTAHMWNDRGDLLAPYLL